MMAPGKGKRMRKLILDILVVDMMLGVAAGILLLASPAFGGGFCTPDKKWAGDAVIIRTDAGAREVFVRPQLWAAMAYESRAAWARWLCECVFDGKRVSIRHGDTGKVLAKYKRAFGYSVEE